MSAQETLTTLKKLKVDCLYNKDTQFNAARRVYSDANRFKLFLIAGTIFASFATIMNVGLWDKIETDTSSIQVIVNILGALGGFLVLYSTTFSDHNAKLETSNKHNNVGNTINLLYKKIRLTEAAFIDNLINEQDLFKKVEEYTNEYHSICNAAPLTKDVDFVNAKTNFEKGYSEYTQKELTL